MSKKVAFLAAAALVLAVESKAAELGALSIYSAVGEPFSARLNVSQVDPKVKPLLVRLAPPAAYARQGLTQSSDTLGFRVKLLSQSPYQVAITGKNAMMATTFPLIVELTDGTQQKAKLYTVHLKQRTVAAPGTATASARSASSGKASAAALSSSGSSSLGSVAARKGQTAWSVATSVRDHYNNAPMNQLIVAMVRKNPGCFEGGAVSGLKGGCRLALPSAAEVGAIDAATGWTYVRSEPKADATRAITSAQRVKAAKALGNAANRRVAVTEKAAEPVRTTATVEKKEPVKTQPKREPSRVAPSTPAAASATPVSTRPAASAAAPVATVTAGGKTTQSSQTNTSSTVPETITVPTPSADGGRADNRAVAGSGYSEEIAQADAAQEAAKAQTQQSSGGSLWWLWIVLVLVLGAGGAGGWIWWKRRESDEPALSQLRPIKFLRTGIGAFNPQQKAAMDDMLSRRMAADEAAARGIPGDPLMKQEPSLGAAAAQSSERVEPSFGAVREEPQMPQEPTLGKAVGTAQEQGPDAAFAAALAQRPTAMSREEPQFSTKASFVQETKAVMPQEPKLTSDSAARATPIEPHSAYGAAMGRKPMTEQQWASKLSKARDYANIGATRDAIALAGEVAAGGTTQQRKEAVSLLRRLGVNV